MAKSEQWWALGLVVGEEHVRVRNTRSRKVRDSWMRADHDGRTAYYVETWTVGGAFDGECYAAGEIARADEVPTEPQESR